MIGIIDSGLGGLAVTAHILEQFPQAPIIYIADQKYVPYGTKSVGLVRSRVNTLVTYLAAQGSTHIVIACNTATTATPIQALRLLFPAITFIGIEPPIKPLAKKSTTRSVALLATPLTCRSAQVNHLIARFGHNLQVLLLPAPKLVEQIESDYSNQHQITQLLTHYLQPISKTTVDLLGIGCTHFSFIKPSISKLFPNLSIIDPTAAVSRQTLSLHPSTISQSPTQRFITTGDPVQFSRQLHDLLRSQAPVESLEI